MTKYAPLQRFLEACTSDEAPLTFAEIERILGADLPPSKAYPAWWSNNPANNVMTRAWLAAGFKTERVDVAAERVVFRRDRDAPAEAGGPPAKTRPRGGLLDRLRASLGGTVHVPPGVDLTQPTGETWDAER